MSTFFNLISTISSLFACVFAYRSVKQFNESSKSDFFNKRPILCVYHGRLINNIFSFDFKNFGNRIAREIKINITLFKIIKNKQVLLYNFEPSLFLSELIPNQESLLTFDSRALQLESELYLKLHFTYVDTGDNSNQTHESFFKISLSSIHGFNILNLNESEFKQLNETH